MTLNASLKSRIRRLERQSASIEKPGIGERLRRADERRMATPADVLAMQDRTSLDAFAGRESENSLAGRFARARLRMLAGDRAAGATKESST